MRKGFLASLTLLLATGLAWAEPPASGSSQPPVMQPWLTSIEGAKPVDRPAAACPVECCPVPVAAPCGPPGRVWASAEYLLWWIKDSQLPPLVTASPASAAGVLGPSTGVLVGGSDLDHDAFSGGRFIVGFWLNDCHTIGLETEYFFLGTRTDSLSVSGFGGANSGAIARPFINAVTGREDSELVSFPGLVSGTVNVSTSSRLWGAEENAVINLCCSCESCSCTPHGYRVDLLAGFRYLELDEGLTISESLTVLPTATTGAGTRFGLVDEFDTHNRFYGGQVGARAEYWWGRFFTDALAKVALGSTHESVTINGATIISAPGATPVVREGGLLALPTNIGHFSRDRFSVVPEVGINVGYAITSNLRAFVGYTFLYWSDVARPGNQIDRVINPTQIPTNMGAGTLVGPARPAVNLRDTDFWAQGVNFGVEFRY
jgi:hypothetical protein